MKLCANFVKPTVGPYCLSIFLAALFSCRPSAEERQGRELAAKYCSGCHLTPEPALLDKTTWREGVLPIMGVYLGFYPEVPTPSSESFYHEYLASGAFPAQPLLSEAEWVVLQEYFTKFSPEKLVPISRDLRPGTRWVADDEKATAPGPTLPATTAILFDSTTRRLWVADNIHQKIYLEKLDGTPTDSLGAPGPVSAIARSSDGFLVTTLGSIAPSERAEGSVSRVRRDAASGRYLQETLLTDLHRPVQTLEVDLDRDGQNELVVCEFGFLTGRLAYWKKDSAGTYQSRPLSPTAGALKVLATDWNRDGWPDLLALFGQGDERVSVFINKKGKGFQEKVLLRFPPSYGSMDFDLQDFDRDGRPDLLYVCGDNADYSRVLKPYHGLYIFRNEGDGVFEKKYFFPVNGAYRAKVRDFDRDGDLDVAVVSFFADYARTPHESFVYLEASGPFSFRGFTTPHGQRGRWVALEAGDVDHDGDTDLILANSAVADGFDQVHDALWRHSPPYLILKNTTRQPNAESPKTARK